MSILFAVSAALLVHYGHLAWATFFGLLCIGKAVDEAAEWIIATRVAREMDRDDSKTKEGA